MDVTNLDSVHRLSYRLSEGVVSTSDAGPTEQSQELGKREQFGEDFFRKFHNSTGQNGRAIVSDQNFTSWTFFLPGSSSIRKYQCTRCGSLPVGPFLLQRDGSGTVGKCLHKVKIFSYCLTDRMLR